METSKQQFYYAASILGFHIILSKGAGLEGIIVVWE